MTIWNLLDERYLEVRLHRTPAIMGEPAYWYCMLYDPTSDNISVGMCISPTNKNIVVPFSRGNSAVESIHGFVEAIRGQTLAIISDDEDGEPVEFIPVPSDLTA